MADVPDEIPQYLAFGVEPTVASIQINGTDVQVLAVALTLADIRDSTQDPQPAFLVFGSEDIPDIVRKLASTALPIPSIESQLNPGDTAA